MNYLYTGDVGHGKTYHVINFELIPALKKGRNVYTNIDGLDDEGCLRDLAHICDLSPVRINDLLHYVADPDEMRALAYVEPGDKEGVSLRVPKGSVLIIDEAQEVWFSRAFKDTAAGFMSLLSKCRHHGIDLVFITQDRKQLEVAVSRLCNYSYHVTNMSLLTAWLGNQYMINVRNKPDSEIILYRLKGKFDTRIFRCYKSSMTDDRAKRSGGFLRLWHVAVAGLLVVYLVKNLSAFTWWPGRVHKLQHLPDMPALTPVSAPKQPEAVIVKETLQENLLKMPQDERKQVKAGVAIPYFNRNDCEANGGVWRMSSVTWPDETVTTSTKCTAS